MSSFASYAPPKNDYITHVSKEVVFPLWSDGKTDAQVAAEQNKEVDLRGFISDSSKKAITEALLDILSHPNEKTSASILDIASILGLPYANPDSTQKSPLEIVNSLGSFFDEITRKNRG